jgi:hypothetical protein
MLGVWEIFENTTSEVVNDEGAELWTWSLIFDIPIRCNNEVRQDIVQTGRRSPTKIGAQIDVVLLSLQAIEWIGYYMPNFLSLKIRALIQHSLDVSRISERHETFNHMDVVCRVWYESNVYLFLLLYERFLIFFVCPLAGFALWFHLCYMWLAAILTRALKRLGYAWDFVEAMGQRMTADIQYYVKFR